MDLESSVEFLPLSLLMTKINCGVGGVNFTVKEEMPEK